MDELRNYVDGLFRHQHETTEIKELKEEIISNMTAKRSDLIAQGMGEAEATQKAKESLASIDGLVEGNQLTYVDRYHKECLQISLQNCIIAWIFSLPLLFTTYAPYSYLGCLTTAILGLLYFIKTRRTGDAAAFLSVSVCQRRGKRVWIIWGLFFLVAVGSMAALTFGSNLWFGQGVSITGPYQLANIAVRFYLPLLTIAIPVAVGSFTKILLKHEKGGGE